MFIVQIHEAYKLILNVYKFLTLIHQLLVILLTIYFIDYFAISLVKYFITFLNYCFMN